MSYSLPSGLTFGTIQISRESTMPLIRGSVAYLRGQLADQVQRHLDRQVLARVLAGGEQHLGLALVDADVVGDLDRPQLAALVAGADRRARGDRPGARRSSRRSAARVSASLWKPASAAGKSAAAGAAPRRGRRRPRRRRGRVSVAGHFEVVDGGFDEASGARRRRLRPGSGRSGRRTRSGRRSPRPRRRCGCSPRRAAGRPASSSRRRRSRAGSPPRSALEPWARYQLKASA